MGVESSGQRLRHSRILLEDNYTLSHTCPDLQPSSTGETVDSLTRAAGWPRIPQLHRQLKLSSRGRKFRTHRRAADLSAIGSNGSAWSFPFFFSRISTFPSACSSSLRQAEESCIPSSKRVRDFSKGTSPFSSS